ncbi:pyrroline-5-carboxylate reductase [Hungatella effluvii]|uniref:Pyrroline-5-carboxylate reductase n=1 Tax=Hungatella effluvii TaxID=1096246 RepID=A0A2V3XV22_9FIRM|nr:pyrroline-5-carboxylate reductase [Hungatella effluvii]PXX44476.1 pyrroline-5-carboxylate reductase [Hungatella effluvii]
MERKFGFIGGGNMCRAIIEGMLKAGITEPGDILVSDKNHRGLEALKAEYGIGITDENCKTAAFADILILAVKPNVCPAVIAEIRETIRRESVVVSIAAGLSLPVLMKYLKCDIPVIRVMPNTPAMVGEGMAAVCSNGLVSRAQMEDVLAVFRSFGRAEEVAESLFDVVTAVSGSSPAYVYLFIEAMADAAVAGGMPRGQAYTFCAQAVTGSARMVLETGKHPGELKDMVCSPGGTTIDAVMELEERGMRSAVQNAVTVCMRKSKSMGKQQEDAV